MHIVIKSHNPSFNNQKLGNVFVYPASSHIKIFRIGGKIISQFPRASTSQLLITSQDPFELGLIGYLLKKRFNLSLQLQAHTDFLSSYFWRESLRNKIRVLLGKVLVKKADGLRVVSERVKDSLIAGGYTRKPIFVLPIVYDMDRFSKSEIRIDLHKKYPDYDFIILSASRLTREKNVGLAIKAMSEVVKKHPRALLLIVGSGSEESGLKLLTTRYSLQTNVIFEPWTKDIASYYKSADVFILTSNYEGGARSPAEAVASGLPVVMTDVPPARETVIDSKNGFVVPVGNYRQLADRLIELISNEDKRVVFQEQSLAGAVGFITKDVYLKLYYQALIGALSQNKKL